MAATGETAPIRFQGLTKRYGPAPGQTGRAVVDGLTAEIPPGRVTGFLGPNGAGKTTTLKMLLGLITPTAGQARFGDRPYTRLPRAQRQVGASLGPEAHPGRSGRNHLRVLAATSGVGRERIDELLKTVGLADDARRPVGHYSLGMRQRLALAGALLADPRYLVLDEPANGLDPDGIRWLRRLLREQAEAGKVVLVSSHLLAEIQSGADDALVIHRGRLIHHGPLEALGTTDRVARVRVHPDDAQRAVDALARADIPVTGAGPSFTCPAGLEKVGSALFQGEVEIHELTMAPLDLEQAFFRLLQEADESHAEPETENAA